MGAVKMILDRYSIDDPFKINKPENLITMNFNLYNNFFVKVDESLGALQVGSETVEIDILDFENQINNFVGIEGIKYVYSNLLRNLRNYLRTFVRNLNSRG